MMWMWLVKCATAARAMTLASRPRLAGPVSERRSLVDDIDAQNADPGDLDLDLVAGPHPERRLAPQADAVGRAGGDDVAWLQPRHGRQVLYDGGDVEDHVVGRVCCTTLPLSRVVSSRRCGSGMTSAVTSHGPSGPVAGKFLPAVTECFWKSRTLPSRKQV